MADGPAYGYDACGFPEFPGSCVRRLALSARPPLAADSQSVSMKPYRRSREQAGIKVWLGFSANGYIGSPRMHRATLPKGLLFTYFRLSRDLAIARHSSNDRPCRFDSVAWSPGTWDSFAKAGKTNVRERTITAISTRPIV